MSSNFEKLSPIWDTRASFFDEAFRIQLLPETLQQQKQNLDGNYIISEANRITAETEATKNVLKKANEEADTDAQVNAQQKLAALAVEAQRVQALNQERNVRQGQVQSPQQFTQESVPQSPRRKQSLNSVFFFKITKCDIYFICGFSHKIDCDNSFVKNLICPLKGS